MGSQIVVSDTVPPYGQRLLPTVIDDAARIEPYRVLFYNPRNNDPSQGYDQVTTKIFANAINKLCGCVDAHVSLIRESGCELWITSSSGVDDSNTEKFTGRLDIARATAPELVDLLQEDPNSPSYPYEKPFEQGRSDVLALLHTSGSTGLPKLVPLYLGTTSAMDAMHLMDPIDGQRPSMVEWAGTKTLCAMPLFHTAGISFGLYGAVFFRWTVVLPSTGPLVQHVIEESLDSIKLDSAFISPSVLQDISKSPRALDKLSMLKFVASAGGPILQSVGQAIYPRVPVFQIMGMTELQLVPSMSTHGDDWQYFHFHPSVGFEMEPAASSHDGSSDNLFQLVYVKRESLRLTQSIFVTFPHVDRWESKDLYSRHPRKPHLWKYEMRADDVIVLSNGEKFNPLGAEAKLIGHPVIHSAYITGRSRFQAAVLIHPTDDVKDMSDSDIIETVWPAIREANESLPAYAQIHWGFVKIARRPFALTPKGTLARKATESLFGPEIEEVYARSDRGDESSLLPIDTATLQTLQDGVAAAVRAVSGNREVGLHDTLFAAGLDSLHVLRLARVLRSSSGVGVQAGAVYENPSIAQLSAYLWAQLRQQQQNGSTTDHRGDDTNPNGGHNSNGDNARATAISRMLAKHSPSFRRARNSSSKGEYVVLTGSTGSIGPFLLDRLCRNERVAGIWCLNRREDARQRQVQLARANGLPYDWDEGGKVQFLRSDISSAETFGLSSSELQDILHRATIIIHNAWEVNFNLSLPSFEPHIRGLETLVDICRRTRNKIRFYFMSSISAALRWPRDALGRRVPEAEISDPGAAMNGYGASKWVAEHLLARAAEAGVLTLSVFRVGQVGGPVQTFGPGSMWSRRDWVPALIDSSVYLRMLPSDLGLFNDLDWIPVDLLATVLDQLMFNVRPKLVDGQEEAGQENNSHEEIHYYNLLNPATERWSKLLPILIKRLGAAPAGSPDEMQVGTLKQWIARLQDSEASVVRAIDTPLGHSGKVNEDAGIAKVQTGLALVAFFQMLDEANTTGARNDSATENGLDEGPRFKIDWAMEKAISGSPALADLPSAIPVLASPHIVTQQFMTAAKSGVSAYARTFRKLLRPGSADGSNRYKAEVGTSSQDFVKTPEFCILDHAFLRFPAKASRDLQYTSARNALDDAFRVRNHECHVIPPIVFDADKTSSAKLVDFLVLSTVDVEYHAIALFFGPGVPSPYRRIIPTNLGMANAIRSRAVEISV
ncbi:hypothetical protein DL771_002490 [Monosporascus sp. 5C6A]|nr:hypothetical protein DL771_002490 [Monosporascus sp. 5C6A]